MPRNSQGLYTLPPSNPVAPDTLIEAAWANPTMEDIAAALTGSLPRNGSAPMTGALILNSRAPTQPREAVSKAYLEQFLAYATGMPVGAVFAFASGTTPPGYLLCNGQAVSRTTYATLFVAIGTVYGSGDGTTTFNVPDLRNEFVRGKPDARVLGNKQAAAFASHIHALSDPSHAHAISIWSGTENANHTHSVSGSTSTEGSHAHGLLTGTVSGGSAGGTAISSVGVQAVTESAGSHAHSFSATSNEQSAAHSHAVNGSSGASATGVSMGATGGDETRPQNIALDYYIKATNDTAPISGITSITSSDDQMISIDNTNPVSPELVIRSNVAFGTVKLDASGQIPLSLFSLSSQQLLGYWNASGGQTPSEVSPSTNYSSGDTFIISVTGTLTVYDPVTLVASPTVVDVGSLIQYIENSVTNPTGWYYVVVSSTVAASQVSFAPAGSIAATNVQSAIVELDGDVVANTGAIAALTPEVAAAVKQTAATGAAIIPSGTDAERPTGVDGYFRYNNQQDVFEGYTPNGWGQVGGGQMYGAAAVKAIFYNAQSIAENIDVLAGQNGLSAGPVTVENGFTVTVANGSTWSVV